MKYTFKKERSNIRNYSLMADMWHYDVPYRVTRWIFSKQPAHKAMDTLVEECYLDYQKKKNSIISKIWYRII